MRKLVVVPLLMGMLLAGCGSPQVESKTVGAARDRIPEWVDTVGVECGVLLEDGTPDPTAMCGIGEALYIP